MIYKNFYSILKRNFNETLKNKIKIGNDYSIIHGNYKYDGYMSIKSNEYEQKKIIIREKDIFKKWKKMFHKYYSEWEKDAFNKHMTSLKDIGEQFGDFVYFNQTAKEGYDILKRRINNEEEVVLDLKTIPFLKDINTTNLKNMRISNDHRFISFVIDLENNEKYSGGIFDIKNQKYYDKVFHNISAIEFGNNNHIFYLTNNNLNRPYQIKQHFMNWENKSIKEDKIIYEEKDSEVYIETSPTKDNNYLIINALTKNDSKISLLNLQNENSKIVTLFKRKSGIKYFIEHAGDSFFILSNLIVESEEYPEMKKNEDFKLFTIKDSEINNTENLKLLIFPEELEYFEDIDIFKDHLVVYYKKNLNPYVLIHDINKINNKNTRIKIGEIPGEVNPSLNKGFLTDNFKLEYTNPINYKTLYQIDLNTKNMKILQNAEIKGFNKTQFEVIQTEAPSKDGEMIPITLLHKKGIKMNRKNKTLLMGYGAYGLNMELTFDHVLLTAAERGWVIAYCHLRGGSEKGKKWHEMGKLLNKPNVIEDYIACAYELIQSGYTHPNYIAAYGQSAGGSVVAQAVNLKPDLFKAVVLSHPFLDVLNTLLDDSLPLTIPDWQEYGNPYQDKNNYFSLMSYSPYENISNQEYPPILISMSLDDPRVPYWGTLKYIEKLRTKAKLPIRTPNFIENNICVKIDQSGHFGPVNQEEALKAKIWELMWCDKMLLDNDNILL